jgi:hypothetical protein
MPKCPSCDHFNRPSATQCEKCGVQIEKPASSTPAAEPGSLEADIFALMQGGKKIEAIKVYRQRAGVDLHEAKKFVESLATKHGVAPSTGGCLGVVLLMLLASAVFTGAVCVLAVS